MFIHLFITRATLAVAWVLAVVACLSVCPAVCLSQVGVLLKRLNAGSRKQRHTIARPLEFSDAENLGKTQAGSQPTEAPNAGGVAEIVAFQAKRCQLSSVASLLH